jgi:hypothetical protein
MDHATVFHRLDEKLGFKIDCVPWGLHLLTGELTPRRKQLTGLIIPYREAPRKDDWRHLARGDES